VCFKEGSGRKMQGKRSTGAYRKRQTVSLQSVHRQEHWVPDHMSISQLIPQAVYTQRPVACLWHLIPRATCHGIVDRLSMGGQVKIPCGAFKKGLSVCICGMLPMLFQCLHMVSLSPPYPCRLQLISMP